MTDLRQAAQQALEKFELITAGEDYGKIDGLITALRAALAEQPAEQSVGHEALVQDAERYRWLRNEADYLRLPQGSPQVLMTDEWGEPISTGKEAYPQKDRLDAAIDAAMREKQS